MAKYTVSADHWQPRMPEQCFFVGVKKGGLPMAVNGHVEHCHLQPILASIHDGTLRGDIYSDGEVWIDAELLAFWLESQHL